MKLSVLVISANVGKTPEEVAYSFVFDEIVRLARRKVRVHVTRFRYGVSEVSYGVYFHDISKASILSLPLVSNRLAMYPRASLLRSPRTLAAELLYSHHIERVAKIVKPDVMHAHFAYLEGWAALLAKASSKLGCPLVVTLHGYDILTESRVGYGIRLDRRYSPLIENVLRRADAVVVASRAVYKEAVKVRGDASGIHLIPNGVDVEQFNPSIDGTPIRKLHGIEGKQVVFTLRHLRPIYGISWLLLAAKLVLSERKNTIFIIGGEGPLREHYESLKRRIGISDGVIFTGRIPKELAPLYYAASDIVVMPSLQEAWGLVATEAMACGRPVVATSVGGLPDQVIDGFNGFLVPPRDPRALADRILYLLDNPSEARRMGLNGRRLAVEKFNIEKRIARILELYESLRG
jgi:glycosyltransferase involved in cell wall biosynthesis